MNNRHYLVQKLTVITLLFSLSAFSHDNSKNLQQHSGFFRGGDVKLLEGPFKTARDRATKTLLEEYEPDKFLAWIRPMAGLKPKAEKYQGWETWATTHSLGHYLSGCSMAYDQTGNTQFKKRVDYIVDELGLIQEKSGCGFICKPSDRAVFENEIAKGDINPIGFELNGMRVPFYLFHKMLSGLRDAYELTGNTKALDVEKKFADWIFAQIMHLPDDQFQKLLKCEHGGVAESFADLYNDTRDTRYLELSRRFFDTELMTPVWQGTDNLSGLHANTQIPKYIGLARIYELTGNEREKITADNFWQFVTSRHSYVTGGNSFHEHFGPAGKLNDYLNPDVTETCNTYNMLKLSKHIFGWKPDSKTADYMERTILNHSLSSINPENGRVTYHLSLNMPARRVFNNIHGFTCCEGSGMEHHFLYSGLIYFRRNSELYVNQFIASELNWKEKSVTITQETKFPFTDNSLVTIHSSGISSFTLLIRKPGWLENELKISLNGKPVDAELHANGYYSINRIWKNGDKIALSFPFTLRTESMPDNKDRLAIFYGPVLLGGDLGPLEAPEATAGDFVPVLLIKNKPVTDWVKSVDLSKDLFKTFKAGDPRDITLKPFFQLSDRYHSIYWDVFEPGQWIKVKKMYLAKNEGFRNLENKTTDLFQPGEIQQERDHNFRGENSIVAEFAGTKGRVVKSGWFSFEMNILPDKPMALVNKYWGQVSGNDKATFDVLVDGMIITTQIIHWSGNLFEVIYQLPVELTKGKTKVTVTLKAQDKFQAGPLCGSRILNIEM